MRLKKKVFVCLLICSFCLLSISCSREESAFSETEHSIEEKKGSEEAFLLPIEDVFSITGRGIVVVGRVENGIVHVGDIVEIVGLTSENREAKVEEIEIFRELLDQAAVGDNVGVLLDGVERDEVERGQVLATPGSIEAHTRFVADVYALEESEGGDTSSIKDGEKLQFYFRTTDVTGQISFLTDNHTIAPGGSASIEVALAIPIAIEENLEFAIRDDGKTIAAGIIREILFER